MLYRLALTFKSAEEILKIVTIQMKATEQYFDVVLLDNVISVSQYLNLGDSSFRKILFRNNPSKEFPVSTSPKPLDRKQTEVKYTH